MSATINHEVFVKYFNGVEPLEKIPIREGLKRKVVWDILGKLGLGHGGGAFERGVGGCDEKGANNSVMIVVRHW